MDAHYEARYKAKKRALHIVFLIVIVLLACL